jgi:uncharacterized protein (TIGR02246 family)
MNDQTSDETSILEVRHRHLDAGLAHDIDALVETFTEDGVELPPGSPAIVGREAYRAHCEVLLQHAGEFSWNFDIAELVVTGDWAFEWGTFQFTAGDGSEDKGKYLWVYQRGADDQWRFARTIYNSGV